MISKLPREFLQTLVMLANVNDNGALLTKLTTLSGDPAYPFVVNKASEGFHICKCSSLFKYGTDKSGRMSTENLFDASNRDGQVMATMCKQIRIQFVKLSSSSSRV